MFACYKNSYLQTQYPEFNPRLINRCVQRARDFIWNDVHDLEPPFNRLTSEQPCIPVKNVDVTRRPLGFGRRAMPKLRRELHNLNLGKVLAAIESICDLVHDPERGYEAVNLKIIDRMADLLMHEWNSIRERTANTLKVLSGLSFARQAIVDNKLLLENLTIVIEDEYPEVRLHVAALLEMTARFWKTADVLVNDGFIPILLNNLLEEKPEIVEVHLRTLKSLMYGEGKYVALENDGYAIFTKLLEDVTHSRILSGACQCLMLLTSTCIGEKMAEDDNLLEPLSKLIMDERPEVHSNVASVIMFCTVRSKAKLLAFEYKKVPERLLALSKNQLNPTTQIYCIKALTNLCEHPEIRKKISREHFEDVQNIQLNPTEPALKTYKDTLLSIVGWQPASST